MKKSAYASAPPGTTTPWLSSAIAIREAHELIAGHRDLHLGLADASIAVLARRHRTRDILTLDERRFGALRGPRGKGFRLLPRDA